MLACRENGKPVPARIGAARMIRTNVSAKCATLMGVSVLCMALTGCQTLAAPPSEAPSEEQRALMVRYEALDELVLETCSRLSLELGDCIQRLQDMEITTDQTPATL